MSFDQAAFLTDSMSSAGASMTAAALAFIIMATVCFPEAARVVQKEIHDIISHDR
ncbi:hypothetical protein IW261DRAFT_1518797, partial [Armillaria novae-zelandiae]